MSFRPRNRHQALRRWIRRFFRASTDAPPPSWFPLTMKAQFIKHCPEHDELDAEIQVPKWPANDNGDTFSWRGKSIPHNGKIS